MFTTTDSTNDDVRVDPRLLAHTAGRVLDAATGLGDGTRALVAGLAVSSWAVGALGRRITAELDAGTADAQGVLDQLTSLLQGDADKLYRAAFAAQDAEGAATTHLGGPATHKAGGL